MSVSGAVYPLLCGQKKSRLRCFFVTYFDNSFELYLNLQVCDRTDCKNALQRELRT